TVTWPLCAFWTSIVEPVRAATDPEVKGNAPPLGVVAAPATPATARLAASEMAAVVARTDRRMCEVGYFTVFCSPSIATCPIWVDLGRAARCHSLLSFTAQC